MAGQNRNQAGFKTQEQGTAEKDYLIRNGFTPEAADRILAAAPAIGGGTQAAAGAPQLPNLDTGVTIEDTPVPEPQAVSMNLAQNNSGVTIPQAPAARQAAAAAPAVTTQTPKLDPARYTTVQDQYNAGAAQILNSGETAAQAQTAITDQQAAQMQASLEAMKAANAQADTYAQTSFNDFNEILRNMEQSRQEELDRQKAANDKANRQDYNARVAGGLGEAAAALVNLIGTANGGTPAQWTSPQQEWAQRADAYRREREARFDNLRAQLDNLAMQRAQIQYQFGQGRAQQMRSDAAADMGATNAISQTRSAGQLQAAGTRQQSQQAAINTLLQGTNAAVSQFNTNRAYSQTAAHQSVADAAARDALATQRYMLGYYDQAAGKWVPAQATKEEQALWAAATGKTGKGSGTTDSTRKLKDENGNYVDVQMTDAQYKKMFDQVRREIEDDIEKEKGKNWASNHRSAKDADVRDEVEKEMVKRLQAQAAAADTTGAGKNWYD